MDDIQLLRLKLISGFQTVVLVLSMGLLLGLLGWFIGGTLLAMAAMSGVILLYVFNPIISPHLVMKMYHARRLSYHETPRLHAVVEALAKRAELPGTPALFYFPGQVMNAFAVGTRQNASIAISDALLRNLDLREVSAVLAHELSHVKFNDTRVMGFAQISSRVTNVLSMIGQLFLVLSLPMVLAGGSPVNFVAVLMLVFAPTMSLFLQMALSRTREYHADLGAARMTKDPEALASALSKMDRYNRNFMRRFLWPGYHRVPEAVMLRTHPPTKERIRRLLEIQGYSFAPADDIRRFPLSTHPRPTRFVSHDPFLSACWNGLCL